MNAAATWAIQIHAHAFPQFYTGEKSHGRDLWSFDPAKAARFATESEAHEAARRMPRWLCDPHGRVVQLPDAGQ